MTTADAAARAHPDGTDSLQLLEIHGLTKSFPGVVAVDDVDLNIAPGEIVALLGQNGAGKSTLIQVLSGVHGWGSYSGEIVLGGAQFRPASVSEAEDGGVAFLAQEVSVAPNLTVGQTMALNREPTRFGLVDDFLIQARAKEALTAFGIDVDPAAQIGDLDLATQQLVLIVRALSQNARLLILDEPTAALTDREATRLFDRMRALALKGVAIIFVSHRLAEVFEISDRIVVMRDGRINGTFITSDTSRNTVVASMIGTGVAQSKYARRAVPGQTALSTKGLTVQSRSGGRPLVIDVDLSVAHGEVLGLFGLLGSGAVETAVAIFGAWLGEVSGEISVDGTTVSIADPSDAIRFGIGLIAQDRRDGLSGSHSIFENTILASLDTYAKRFGFVDAIAARREAMDLFARLKIKAETIDALVGTLSGGNQQKVQIARWLAAGAKILLLIDPTRGVDVGARAEIMRIWAELADAGCAILLVSSDAEELVEICDRVLVYRDGTVADVVQKSELSEERLLRLAAGV